MLSSWLSHDKSYGFIELRSPTEADLVFGMKFEFPNLHLKIGRPKAYVENSNEKASGIRNKLLGGQQVDDPITCPVIHGPSKVIVIRDFVRFEDVARYDKACELFSEVLQLCQ